MENNFLREEIRNDFHVDINRKKIWSVELELLEKILNVCQKYNLKCFAFGGTLLGAVRHEGFIPWDDDIDIALTREDYTKLCEVAAKEFEEPYFFQTALTDRNYFSGIARLRKTTTTGIVTFMCNHKYNNGIFIDIYVYDKIPENKKELKKVLFKIKCYETLLNNYYYTNSTSIKMKIISPVFKLLKHLISYEKLFEKYLKVCTSYSTYPTKRLGFLCMPQFIKYEMTTDDIKCLINARFEFLNIMIPKNYDSILKKSYGNYMEFPPVEERGKWHEDIIIFDPDISFIDYYKKNSDRFKHVLKEYTE